MLLDDAYKLIRTHQELKLSFSSNSVLDFPGKNPSLTCVVTEFPLPLERRLQLCNNRASLWRKVYQGLLGRNVQQKSIASDPPKVSLMRLPRSSPSLRVPLLLGGLACLWSIITWQTPMRPLKSTTPPTCGLRQEIERRVQRVRNNTLANDIDLIKAWIEADAAIVQPFNTVRALLRQENVLPATAIPEVLHGSTSGYGNSSIVVSLATVGTCEACNVTELRGLIESSACTTIFLTSDIDMQLEPPVVVPRSITLDGSFCMNDTLHGGQPCSLFSSSTVCSTPLPSYWQARRELSGDDIPLLDTNAREGAFFLVRQDGLHLQLQRIDVRNACNSPKGISNGLEGYLSRYGGVLHSTASTLNLTFVDARVHNNIAKVFPQSRIVLPKEHSINGTQGIAV